MKLLEIISVIVALFILLFAGLELYQFIYSKIPDYIKDENIPKGYVQTDGFSHDGWDWEEYYYYQYDAIPTLPKEYQTIDNLNIWVVKEDVHHFQDVWRGDDEAQVDFYKDISEGDYFIKHYYDNDGNEVDSFQEHEKMYFYDIESNTLHYFYYAW